MTDRDAIDGASPGRGGSASDEPAPDAEALQRAESEAAAEAAVIAPEVTAEPVPADGAHLVAVGPGPVGAAARIEPATGPGDEGGAMEVAADADAADAGEGAAGLTSADYTVAFSPRQVAVGLAIVAGLVAWAVTRRRGRGGREEG